MFKTIACLGPRGTLHNGIEKCAVLLEAKRDGDNRHTQTKPPRQARPDGEARHHPSGHHRRVRPERTSERREHRIILRHVHGAMDAPAR